MQEIAIKVVITTTHGLEYLTCFFEWQISLAPSSLRTDIDNCLRKLSEELRVAIWKAYAIGENIFNVEIFLDNVSVTHTDLLSVHFGKIDPSEIDQMDSDIIDSIRCFISNAGPQIAFRAIGIEKFVRQ